MVPPLTDRPFDMKWTTLVFITHNINFFKFHIAFDFPVWFPKLLIETISGYDKNWKHTSTEIGPHAISTKHGVGNVGKIVRIILDGFPLASKENR